MCVTLTGTTAVTKAPFPVEYIGKRKKGIRKRKTSAATHSMKLCHTPGKKKREETLLVFPLSVFIIWTSVQRTIKVFYVLV